MSLNTQTNAHPPTVSTTTTNSFAPSGDIFAEGANPFAPKPVTPVVTSDASGLPNNPTVPVTAPVETVPNANGLGQGQHPLDKYVAKPDNTPSTPADPTKPPEVQNITPPNVFDTKVDDYKKLLERQDFVGEISADVMTAIQQGDGAALAGIINTAIQSGASASAFLASQVSKSGIETRFNTFTKDSLPSLLKDHTFEQTWMNTDDSILKHPAVAGMAETKMQEIRTQFPEATADEIKSKTIEYFKDFAQALNQSEAPTPQQSQETISDMDKLFG